MEDLYINFDRWVELLQRTAQGNNWKALHPRFHTDNSYFREMKNYHNYDIYFSQEESELPHY